METTIILQPPEKFTKHCDKYQGDSKYIAINCDGIEDSEAFDVWHVNADVQPTRTVSATWNRTEVI